MAVNVPQQQQQMQAYPPQQQQMQAYPPQQIYPPQQQQEMQAYPPQNYQPPMTGSMLWPQGVGVTDREFDNPDDCSCPPCYCWTKPIWFASSDMKHRSAQAGWRPNVCRPGFTISNADVLGQRMDFEGKEVCGVETCYEPELHVYDSSGGQQRKVGHIIMKMPICNACSCSEIDLAVAKDANGVELFARQENPWCPEARYLRKMDYDCCGYWEYQWPIRSKKFSRNAPPVGQIIYRFHYCFMCHPIWVGFRQIPGIMSPDDQKLLLGLAIVRLWRAEKEAAEENAQGTNDGNPVY